MLWFPRKPPLGVRAVFLPGGVEVLAHVVLPAEVRAVPVRILDMGRFPWVPWRGREYTLGEDVVGRLHATLSRHYPDLGPGDVWTGFDGIDVRLGVERGGARPADCQHYRFRMWTRDLHPSVPAVQVAWDLLDPWRVDSMGPQRYAENG